MKTKNFSKKLALRKETVSHLDISKMYNIKGGAYSDPGSTCKLCPTVGGLCLPTTKCPSPVTDTDCYETIEYACYTLPVYGGYC